MTSTFTLPDGFVAMNNPFDHSYHSMLERILREGVKKSDRTGTGTLSVFGHFQKFDLSQGFPLITTKRIFLKGIIHELLWMLSGSDNVQYLQNHGVNIWDEWADDDGSLGPVYGVQWRKWQSYDDQARGNPAACDRRRAHGDQAWVGDQIDQIDQIVHKIKNNPWDRRIMLSAWNVAELDAMNLPPCHFNAQFVVTPKNPAIGYMSNHENEPLPGKLNCLMNIRSWDTFLGGPFNIAQYALLTMMLAQVTGLDPGELMICSGDTHIYLNHIDQVHMQLSRVPKPPPKIILDPSIKDIDDFKYEHFKLEGYDPHPHISGDISV